jgi:hypothetical protein
LPFYPRRLQTHPRNANNVPADIHVLLRSSEARLCSWIMRCLGPEDKRRFLAIIHSYRETDTSRTFAGASGRGKQFEIERLYVSRRIMF